MIIILCNENKVNEIYDTVYDIRLQKLRAKTLKIANFKHTYNEKSIKLTGLIRFLLARRDNRTSAKVSD